MTSTIQGPEAGKHRGRRGRDHAGHYLQAGGHDAFQTEMRIIIIIHHTHNHNYNHMYNLQAG